MTSKNKMSKRFCLRFHSYHPLVLDRLKSVSEQKNLNIYLRDLALADLTDHDSLITRQRTFFPPPRFESYTDIGVSFRLNPETDADLIQYLTGKTGSLSSYFCSLVYHDLGEHELADAVYCPDRIRPPKVKKCKSKKDKGIRIVHFDVRIPPEHPLVVSQLELKGFDPAYVQQLIRQYADGKDVLLGTPLRRVPPVPYSYYRRKSGCTVRLEYDIPTTGAYIDDDPLLHSLLRLERDGLLSPFIICLVYHDLGRHDLADAEERRVSN